MTDQKNTPATNSTKDEKKTEKKTMTGAGILWECLEREGVRVVFGYPGGAILPAYDALKHSKIHHVLVRHEQGATHMADGYARASGEVGVAVATSGPGATNMVTGIATAMPCCTQLSRVRTRKLPPAAGVPSVPSLMCPSPPGNRISAAAGLAGCR